MEEVVFSEADDLFNVSFSAVDHILTCGGTLADLGAFLLLRSCTRPDGSVKEDVLMGMLIQALINEGSKESASEHLDFLEQIGLVRYIPEEVN